MQNPAGAIVGAIIISVALLILSRWELVASGTGMGTNGVYRLDRWTGAVVACAQKNTPPDTLELLPLGKWVSLIVAAGRAGNRPIPGAYSWP